LFHFSYKRDYYISSCWAEPSKPERPTIVVGKWIYRKSRKKNTTGSWPSIIGRSGAGNHNFRQTLIPTNLQDKRSGFDNIIRASSSSTTAAASISHTEMRLART